MNSEEISHVLYMWAFYPKEAEKEERAKEESEEERNHDEVF